MEWISIEELPDESQHDCRFLVYDKYGTTIAHFYDDQCDATWFDGTSRMLTNVTHWMPLPSPPEV